MPPNKNLIHLGTLIQDERDHAKRLASIPKIVQSNAQLGMGVPTGMSGGHDIHYVYKPNEQKR